MTEEPLSLTGRRLHGGSKIEHPVTQLITIAPDGSITGLDFKKKGVDLRALGRADIKRISEVEFDSDRQKWTVKFLHGEWAGQLATTDHLYAVNKNPFHWFKILDDLEIIPGTPSQNSLCLFDEYDKAVAFEVAVIQAARTAGLGHLVNPSPDSGLVAASGS